MSDQPTYTIADVARLAGVSVSTVSRILNGKHDVAPATRDRVQQIIAEIGFKPHAQAQRLRAGKTRNLALLFPLKSPGNIPYNPLEVDFILGAAAAAAEKDFLFSLITTPVTKQSLLNLYRSAQIDGLVLMQVYAHDWRADLLRNNNCPFVMIGRCDDNTGLNFIDIDFESAVQTAFDHLVGLGHRKIAFLGQPAEMRKHGWGPATHAWQGYERALATHSLAPLYRETGSQRREIIDSTLELLDEQPDLTAIVSVHEFAPLSVIQALKKRGRNVPDDCSLIAIMNERIGELSSPPMTHVDFPAHAMGYEAVQMLIRRLEGDPASPEHIMIPPRLIIRNSTAPLG
ncbi:MAG: LacI family DNA-binding transcriptional regulator [Anaerolineae bacterium]|nr:LacI family DNA-binding transcriptional regulator [Anaerolineae bacterium]